MTVDELRAHLSNFDGSLPVFLAAPNVLCGIVDVQAIAGEPECPVLVGKPAQFKTDYSQWRGLLGTNP